MTTPGDPAATPDAGALLRQLLGRPAAEVEAWLAANVPPPDFNWRGLAEAAGWSALHDARDAAEALAWARVAGTGRNQLVAGDPDEAWRARIGGSNLRAELINRYGSVPGDPFLDCDELIGSFLTRYDPDFDGIARDSERWTTLPTERVRVLRYVKNEIDVLRRLDRCARFADPEVQRWVRLWPRLP